MKYILIATKGDITKVQVYLEQEYNPQDAEQLKLLGYKVQLFFGHEVKEEHFPKKF